MSLLTLDSLFKEQGFTPNPGQRAAIEHVEGPLLLTAGPGSGKTRVLLWRTLNLIVFHEVDPSEIFLATFTEKAARQLQEGLESLLGMVTNKTGQAYDLSDMALGTVHSICQQLFADRRFTTGGQRAIVPRLLDSLGQYFHLHRRALDPLLEQSGFERHEEYGNFYAGHQFFNGYLDDRDGEPVGSRHFAVTNAQLIFNRFSEEMIADQEVIDPLDEDERMLKLYDGYRGSLRGEHSQRTDFSLLQSDALRQLITQPGAGHVFRHVIVDEYQDTNAVQEALYFHLAGGHRNLCVVGDDDQALYRFRGATVENLVQFANRCADRLGTVPTRVNLQINYRSRKAIVDCYTRFVVGSDWQDGNGGHYRVMDKGIRAHSTDAGVSVVTTDRKHEKGAVLAGLARKIKAMKAEGVIEDYNQVACLFPSLQYRGQANSSVTGLRVALEAEGIPVYAPRAGRFLDQDEAQLIFGLLLKVFNMPPDLELSSNGYKTFRGWLTDCRKAAEAIVDDTPALQDFIKEKRKEWKRLRDDFEVLQAYFERMGESEDADCFPGYLRKLSELKTLSEPTRRRLAGKSLSGLLDRRYREGKPVSIGYLINRVTTVDWSVLDLFYQFMGFPTFKAMFDLAEAGQDEGPVCNLSLVSGYLARFMEEYQTLIFGRMLSGDRFQSQFFNSFCYALYRLGEREFENPDDPFPKGRVPFLTIHQSKGLEFPVVVLGSLGRRSRPASVLETKMRYLLGKTGEPLERMNEFDGMRLFYVGLSRAENLLILPQWKRCQVFEPLKCIREMGLPNLEELSIQSLPSAAAKPSDLGETYSYTGDYLSYLRCSRFYMIFRKYDFAPARSQGMFFGSLVHQTIEDLHLYLLEKLRGEDAGAENSG